MSRLLVHVEGQTEETFVNEILAGHLYQCGYTSVVSRLIGNSRQRSKRGGIRGWPPVRDDMVRHLKQDKSCLVTTMVDYYALPATGAKAWPGRDLAVTLPFAMKAKTVQSAILADVTAEMGSDFNSVRFVPYVMMHEFEGFLFSDCDRFASSIGRPELAPQFQAIRDQFGSPEEINDSPQTAPSKRVEALIPEYEKPISGVLAVLEIGLDVIRAECANFREWLQVLESRPVP